MAARGPGAGGRPGRTLLIAAQHAPTTAQTVEHSGEPVGRHRARHQREHVLTRATGAARPDGQFLARVLDRGAADGHVTPRQLPPPALTDTTPLHARTVGLAEAGMTLADVEQRTTTLVEILARYQEPHTPTVAGVRPGDPRAAVVAAYGAHQLEESPHLYQPGGVYLDVVAADGEHGLRFEVTPEGVVESIHAGYADAITWPEGCA